MVDLPDWSANDVIIIASGPSLNVSQVHALAKAKLRRGSKIKTMVVNDAGFLSWYADWWHCCDREWWVANIERACTFAGITSTCAPDVPRAWVDGYFEITGVEGFDADPGCIRSGRNSGYQALHIAMKCGAKRIGLLGFDMDRSPGGPAHFHPERDKTLIPDYAREWAPLFDGLVAAAVTLDIEILNCTPGSAINAFERVDLLSFLSDR